MAILTFAKNISAPLSQLLADSAFAGANFDYAMMWRADTIELTAFDPALAFDEFPQGRVWGEQCDLQWCTQENGLHLVWMGAENNAVPEIFPKQNHRDLGTPLEDQPRAFFLWGEYDDSPGVKKWLEVKVPRQQDYLPLLKNHKGTPPARVRLQVYTYTLQESRFVYENGAKTPLPVTSLIYRYGKIIGNGGTP